MSNDQIPKNDRSRVIEELDVPTVPTDDTRTIAHFDAEFLRFSRRIEDVQWGLGHIPSRREN